MLREVERGTRERRRAKGIAPAGLQVDRPGLGDVKTFLAASFVEVSEPSNGFEVWQFSCFGDGGRVWSLAPRSPGYCSCVDTDPMTSVYCASGGRKQDPLVAV